MSFYIPTNIHPRGMTTPRYKGTVVCPHCFAEYAPGGWFYGVYADPYDTSGNNFVTFGRIPDDKCPICRRTATEEAQV